MIAAADDNGGGDSRLDDKGLGLYMLSADELFFDGKLLPLHITSKAYDPHDRKMEKNVFIFNP